jgi:hypothetical protein
MQTELQIAIAAAIGLSPLVITPIVKKVRARRQLRKRLAEIVSVDAGCYVCGRVPHDPDCPQHVLNAFSFKQSGGQIAQHIMPEIATRRMKPFRDEGVVQYESNPGHPPIQPFHSGGVVSTPGLKVGEVPVSAVLSRDYCGVISQDAAERARDDFRRRYPNIPEVWPSPPYDSEVTSEMPAPIGPEFWGEPLTQSPPNIGGEDHPEYKGGNYVEPVEIAEEMKGITHYGIDEDER